MPVQDDLVQLVRRLPSGGACVARRAPIAVFSIVAVVGQSTVSIRARRAIGVFCLPRPP